MALLLLLDYHGRIDGLVEARGRAVRGQGRGRQAAASRSAGCSSWAWSRSSCVLVFLRDRPGRYGLRLGDWRAGIIIGLAGCVVMTPVVVALVWLPAFAGYYAPQAAPPLDVVVTTALEVIPAEFFFRGFLLFALLRVTGPIAVVIATLPFAFAHLGKPEVETLSTLVGGMAYGWLDWRTGSVLWSGLAHTWILCSVAVIRGRPQRRPGAHGGVSGAHGILGWMVKDDGTPGSHRSCGRPRRRASLAGLGDRRRACSPRSRPRAGRSWTAGTMYDLVRAAPADVVEGDAVRYGSSASVPSRLEETPRRRRHRGDGRHRLAGRRAARGRGLLAHSPGGTQLVVVANGPSDDQAAVLEGLAGDGAGVDVVWMAPGWATQRRSMRVSGGRPRRS